jgi:hypothetical protein
MIQDIPTIKKHLVDCDEVELPYQFPYNCFIKYITLKGGADGDESFYPGGRFIRYKGEKMLLSNNGREWSVPLHYKNCDGEITYKSRFFILNETDKDCEKEKKELQKVLIAQQKVIQKMTQKIHDLEMELVQIKMN